MRTEESHFLTGLPIYGSTRDHHHTSPIWLVAWGMSSAPKKMGIARIFTHPGDDEVMRQEYSRGGGEKLSAWLSKAFFKTLCVPQKNFCEEILSCSLEGNKKAPAPLCRVTFLQCPSLSEKPERPNLSPTPNVIFFS